MKPGPWPPSRPGTFDFLEFTHFRARSGNGSWILKRKTAAGRFTRAVRTIAQWSSFHRHDPIAEQQATLCRKLRRHAGYYGIAGNSPAFSRLRYEVLRTWRKRLMRRHRHGKQPELHRAYYVNRCGAPRMSQELRPAPGAPGSWPARARYGTSGGGLSLRSSSLRSGRRAAPRPALA